MPLNTNSAAATLILDSELFSQLSHDEAHELARQATVASFGPGELIFKQGDAAEEVYLIQSGEIELTVRTPGDDVLELSTMAAGEVLGDVALLEGGYRMLSATAKERTELVVVDRKTLQRFSDWNTAAALSIHHQFGVLLSERIRNNNASIRRASKSPGGDITSTGKERAAQQGPLSLSPKEPVSGTYRQVLRHMPFFRSMTAEELAEVTELFIEHHLHRGQPVFIENSEGTSCFLIARGAVEISLSSPQGKQRLAVFGPGRMFGEMCLLGGGKRNASCVVREKAVILELPGESFLELMQSGSLLALKFMVAINENLALILDKANANIVARNLRQENRVRGAEGESKKAIKRREAYQRRTLVEKIRDSVIGDKIIMNGPFGPCRMVYADYTATGRSLSFIEDFIRHDVMPYYANTHTESSGTGLQTTRLREDARELIREAVGGGKDDVVIFVGAGATGAIDKMLTVLGLKLPYELDQQYQFQRQIPEDQRPVVFVGPYEHHSNDVTWRMSIADTVMINEDPDGRIDLEHLERELKRFHHRPLKVGSFSAASNVTGIISDDRAIATLLHAYGALSFWDYAAAAPYVDIEMNPGASAEERSTMYKDAIFLSPHKFIGGPGTPGVLVAKLALFKNKVPSIPGGGTVEYVSKESQAFLEDPVHREEGGTPAIIESIRAGLVFQLKSSVGASYIEELEHDFVRRAIVKWEGNPNIWVLGNHTLKRLSIVSFVLRHGEKFLHWNYVVALLNDLFGIQARGGCSCAGPYGHRLFGISEDDSKLYQCEISKGYEGIKPGWVRVNFNYFISEQVFSYIVDAVDLVATHGWRLLPLYVMNPRTAMWTHRDGPPKPVLRLDDVHYQNGEMEIAVPQTEAPDSVLSEYLERGRKILGSTPVDLAADDGFELPQEVQSLRWFPLPSEICRELEAEEMEGGADV